MHLITPNSLCWLAKSKAAQRRADNATKMRRAKKHLRDVFRFDKKVSNAMCRNWEKNRPEIDPKIAAEVENRADQKVAILSHFSKLSNVEQVMLMAEYESLLTINGCMDAERTLQNIMQAAQ